MSIGIVKIKGMQQVISKLKRVPKDHLGPGVARGLKIAGLHLQRESQKIAPVQLGNLKNSAFTRASGSGLKTDVIVGYTAAYAAYVHEDPDKAHGEDFNVKHAAEIVHAKANNLKAATAEGGMFKRGPNQQYKFLEKPAREHRTELLKIIRNEARRSI